MWLDLAIAMSCAGAGLVSGWIVHAIGGLGSQSEVRLASEPDRPGTSPVDQNRAQVTEVAQRLQAYALSMAADVDAHQTKMQAVNNSLSQGPDSSPEAVIRAIGDLIAANEAMQTQLKEAQDRIHEQTMQIESAERRAQTDALTRVPNRRAFDEHIEARVAMGPSQAGTLALLDVDHFKKFNDVYGHRAGDEVLRIVANILHSRLQSFGLVARFGGEEFAIILDGVPIDRAKTLVEQARVAISERDMKFENKCLRISASIGLAQYAPGSSIADWVQQADEALYRSKDAGRDCGHWMDGSTPMPIELDGALSNSTVAVHAEVGPAEMGTAQVTDQRGWDVAHSDVDQVARPESTSAAICELPDIRALESMFEHMRHRTQSGISIVLMAIRCHGEIADSTLGSLLRVARSTMRNVDRIGLAENATLLICMPSVDEEMAIRRARQICRSAEAIGLRWTGNGQRPVSIGIIEAGRTERFTKIVSRSLELAAQAGNSSLDPICVADREAAVGGC